MTDFRIAEFPASRIATIDVCAIGRQKHHMYGLLECDVTESRKKLRHCRASGRRISFTAWLISTISQTIKKHSDAAAFLYGKKSIIIFNDINVSLLVEKSIKGQKVPMPLVIEKADQKSIQAITSEIEDARSGVADETSVVLNRRSTPSERFYYHLPGFLRRAFWRFLLKHPATAYKKMGNVSFTSIGMFGQLKGFFIHTSIHPVSFGIGSVIKKPLVIKDEIMIRDVLNMTVLIDHDVIDGGPMMRFISELAENIEKGYGLS